MGLSANDHISYLTLLREHPPRKIETQREYDKWAAWLEAVDFNPVSTRAEKQLAELVAILLEEFDRRTYPTLFESDPLSTLLHLMEENSLSQADLARILGVSRTTASHICHGTRGISKAIAVKLGDHFKTSASLFLPA